MKKIIFFIIVLSLPFSANVWAERKATLEEIKKIIEINGYKKVEPKQDQIIEEKGDKSKEQDKELEKSLQLPERFLSQTPEFTQTATISTTVKTYYGSSEANLTNWLRYFFPSLAYFQDNNIFPCPVEIRDEVIFVLPWDMVYPFLQCNSMAFHSGKENYFDCEDYCDVFIGRYKGVYEASLGWVFLVWWDASGERHGHSQVLAIDPINNYPVLIEPQKPSDNSAYYRPILSPQWSILVGPNGEQVYVFGVRF